MLFQTTYSVMKRLISYALILGLAVFMTSCDDNFLAPEPQSFFAPENVFQNPAGYEAQVVTMRKNLTSENTGNRANMMHEWAMSESGVPLVQLDSRDLTPSTDRYQNFVGMINDMYTFIKDANVAISRIDDIEWPDVGHRNEVLAEALWHRSYWYLRLVGNYGDVPFVAEEVSQPRLDFRTHTREAVLDKIQSDMEFAVEYLPESAVPGAIERGAGYHLLAKIALYNMDFAAAEQAATTVINGPYELMRGRFGSTAGEPGRNLFWDLHRPENKNLPENSETLIAFVDRFEAPEQARTSNGLYTFRTYNPSWWHSNHRDSEGNRGMIDAGAMYDSLGRGNPDCALTSYQTYDIWEKHGYDYKTTPDMRRAHSNWVEVEDMTYNNPESVNFGEPWRLDWMTGDPYNVFSRMYPIPHYKMFVPEQEGDPRGGNGDWYIYRLAETYLIRAEARYWQDNLGGAAADINMLRERAGAPLIGAGDVTIGYIFDERARELFAESPRQGELARVSHTLAQLGRVDEEIGKTYNPETLHEDNWAYDRIIRHNYAYEEYGNFLTYHPDGLTRYDRRRLDQGATEPLVPLPIGNNWVVIGHSPHILPRNFQWPVEDGLIDANTQGRINQNLGYAGADRNEPPLETVDVDDYNQTPQ